MKMSDLTEKKGPIVGAPKGSQKDARLTPGTDDPSKYMRGGEWEAYKTPQGVNSKKGKVARGVAKEGFGDDMRSMAEFRRFKRNPEQSLEDGNAEFNRMIQFASGNSNEEMGDKFRDLRVTFARHMNSGEYENAMSMLNYANNIREKFQDSFRVTRPTTEGLAPGGAGSSGDLVPAERSATTIAMVKDTAAPNIKKAPRLPGSEAPTKFVKKQIKKSYDGRPGNVSDVAENIAKQVDKIVSESIARVIPQDYSADYELRDDKDQEAIGVASINQGVIELLSVRNDVVEDYNGHIMSRLLSTIVRDADSANANLAIALNDGGDLQQKRFLERFGFREVGMDIMKRTAGSITPPSVVGTGQ